jgi:hypothetical protein
MSDLPDTALTTTESEIEQPKRPSWQATTLIIGGLVGASAGLLAAYLMVKNTERRGGDKPSFGAREGVQIAVLTFGVIRSIANLFDA